MNFKSFFAVFFIMVLAVSCLNKDVVENIKSENHQDFIKYSSKLITSENFFQLNQISNIRLKKYPNDYYAAYFKAFSLLRLNNRSGILFYLDFINQNEHIPNEFKEKWYDLALYDMNKKKIFSVNTMMDIFGDQIDLTNDSQNADYCEPKILSDMNFYYYLDQNGNLYTINRITKVLKKINFYKSRDFIVFDDYIVFNDSINLLKYNAVKDEYKNIFTFNEDRIKFISNSRKKDLCVFEYSESNDTLIKYISLMDNKVKSLPNNFLDSSPEFDYLILKNKEKIEIFDFFGNSIAVINGKFIGFDDFSDQVFYYKDNYLYSYHLEDQISSKLLFLKDFLLLKEFKTITFSRILLCVDNDIIIFNTNFKNIQIIKGELIHTFLSGVLYATEGHDEVYYFNFFNNTKNLLFDDKNILKNIIFSDDQSNLFLFKSAGKIQINNLSDIFL